MRICTSIADLGSTEILLQTDDTSSMVQWLKALQEQALEAQSSSLSAEEVSAYFKQNIIYVFIYFFNFNLEFECFPWEHKGNP